MATKALQKILLVSAPAAIILGGVPAEAIVYNFNNAVVAWDEPDDWINDKEGSASISGFFDFIGSSSITDFEVTFGPVSNSTGTVVPFTFTTANSTAFTESSNSRLVFRSTDTTAGFARQRLDLNLANPLTTSPDLEIDIQESGSSYRNFDNSTSFPIGSFPTRTVAFDAASGSVLSVPAPLGVFALGPLAGALAYCRRRYAG